MADEQIAVVETPVKSSVSVVTSETFAATYADRLFPGAKAEADRNAAVDVAAAEYAKAAPTEKVDDDANDVEGKPRKSLDKDAQDALDSRFSKLTRQREDAKRELAVEREKREAMEVRLAAMESANKPAEVSKTDEKPKVDQFKDAFEYAEALATWSTEQALKWRDKVDAEKAAARERETTVKAWKARQDAFSATTPDYAEVLADSGVNVSDQVRDAILESDVGPQLLYHLASNPKFAEELAGKSVGAALRQIGRLEAKLEKSVDKPAKVDEKIIEKPVARISSAPAPITPIKGASSIANLPITDGKWTGNHAEYKAARASGKIK